MKHRVAMAFCALVLWMVLPLTAMAMSQDEWNKRCFSKTTGTVILYTIDVASDGTKTAREIGSIPAGVYIQVGGADYDLRMYKIVYFINGGEAVAYTYKGASFTKAEKAINFTDGTAITVPEAVANDAEALQKWIDNVAPGHIVYGDGSSPVSPDGALPAENPSRPAAGNHDSASDIPQTLPASEVLWTESESISAEEQAFIATCPSRLKRTVTGYSDAMMTQAYESIPIGTYCVIVNDFHDVVKIAYYKNGERHAACVNASDLLGSYTQYRSGDGSTHTVYTGDPNYAAIIADQEVTYLADSLRQDLDAQVAAEMSGQAPPSAAAGGTKATLTRLGVSTSTIVSNGETMEVPTNELIFGESAPAGKEIAVIYAPRTGKASLRSAASESGKLLKNAKAGVLVRVLNYGKTWTKVIYKDQEGYIKTDCLQFFSAGAQAQGTARISYNGKTNGGTTVNIRNAADKNSAKVAEWKTGTAVAVYAQADGWYEVEADGVRGYVMEEYVTIGE